MVPLKDLQKRRATTEPKDEDDSLSVKQEDIKDEGTDPERIDMLEVRPTFDRGYGLSLHSASGKVFGHLCVLVSLKRISKEI